MKPMHGMVSGAGLQRCGKSCRLRWINYLRPDLKRGVFSAAEENLIIDLHAVLGNRSFESSPHYIFNLDTYNIIMHLFRMQVVFLGENLSIPTICCILSMATHGKKMCKSFWLSIGEFWFRIWENQHIDISG